MDRDTGFAASLALVAGFVDAAVFILLAGLFTAHVTGNFVLLAAELFSTSSGVLAKLLALPVFVAAVGATRLTAIWLGHKGRKTLPYLLAVECGLLGVVAAAGLRLPAFGLPDSAEALAAGMAGVAAMGVQNAIGRIAVRHLAATTVMTVNVTQAVIDAVDLLRGTVVEAAAIQAFMRTIASVTAFAFGAFAAAATLRSFSFGCLLVPIAILAGLIVWSASIPASNQTRLGR